MINFSYNGKRVVRLHYCKKPSGKKVAKIFYEDGSYEYADVTKKFPLWPTKHYKTMGGLYASKMKKTEI